MEPLPANPEVRRNEDVVQIHHETKYRSTLQILVRLARPICKNGPSIAQHLGDRDLVSNSFVV